MMGGYGFGMSGPWGFGMGFGFIVPLLILGLVVWAIVSLVRARTGGAGEGRDGALAILRERFAKGELDSETFQRMRRELDA